MSAGIAINDVPEGEERTNISNVSDKSTHYENIRATDVASTSEPTPKPETTDQITLSGHTQVEMSPDCENSDAGGVISGTNKRATNPNNTAEDGSDFTMTDIRAAVDELDENIDEAFGHAAQSIWRLAASVTGSVSSAVGETPSLGQIRENVTTRLKPLDALSHNLSSRLEAITPADSVAKFAGSVKFVAQNVQRNAQEMERALLSKANGGEQIDKATESAVLFDDVGISVTPRSSTAAINVDVEDTGEQSKSEESSMRVEEEIAKVGASLGKTVGGLWNGLWGSEQGGWELADGDGMPWNGSGSVPTTRFEKRVYELQANPNTYCEPAADLDGFEEWGQDFDLEKRADECIQILSTHDAIAELYERVVPDIVEENIFWMRYFYAKHVLEVEEERRKKLLERAEGGGEHVEEDDGWDDDDWEDVTTSAKNSAIPKVGNNSENVESKNGENRIEVEVNSEELVPAVNNTITAEDTIVEDSGDIPTLSEAITKETDEKSTKQRSKEESSADAVGVDDDWGDDWEQYLNTFTVLFLVQDLTSTCKYDHDSICTLKFRKSQDSLRTA